MLARPLAAALAALLTLAPAPSRADEAPVVVTDPYARETPPNAKVGGVYMTLANRGPAIRLTGVRSDAARMAQIHVHEMDASGVMRMRRVEDGIALDPDATVRMEPGGLHIMLMGLEKPLRRGGTVDLALEFDDGSTVDVAVPVRSIAATRSGSHAH